MDPAIGSACSDTGASSTPDPGSHAEGVRGCDWYLVCAVAVSKATLTSFTDCSPNFEGRVMFATATVSAAVSHFVAWPLLIFMFSQHICLDIRGGKPTIHAHGSQIPVQVFHHPFGFPCQLLSTSSISFSLIAAVES